MKKNQFRFSGILPGDHTDKELMGVSLRNRENTKTMSIFAYHRLRQDTFFDIDAKMTYHPGKDITVINIITTRPPNEDSCYPDKENPFTYIPKDWESDQEQLKTLFARAYLVKPGQSRTTSEIDEVGHELDFMQHSHEITKQGYYFDAQCWLDFGKQEWISNPNLLGSNPYGEMLEIKEWWLFQPEPYAECGTLGEPMQFKVNNNDIRELLSNTVYDMRTRPLHLTPHINPEDDETDEDVIRAAYTKSRGDLHDRLSENVYLKSGIDPATVLPQFGFTYCESKPRKNSYFSSNMLRTTNGDLDFEDHIRDEAHFVREGWHIYAIRIWDGWDDEEPEICPYVNSDTGDNIIASILSFEKTSDNRWQMIYRASYVDNQWADEAQTNLVLNITLRMAILGLLEFGDR